jgi:hypothetical protein
MRRWRAYAAAAACGCGAPRQIQGPAGSRSALLPQQRGALMLLAAGGCTPLHASPLPRIRLHAPAPAAQVPAA